MNDTTRMILIALGVTLLVVVLVPLLFMGGMMAGMMGGQCCGGVSWLMGGLVLLVLSVGVALLTIGVRRRR